MTRSPAELKPVPVRRYRYSKWRWRVLVHALDAVGSVAMRVWRWFRPVPRSQVTRRILVVQLDHLGDAVLSSPLFPLLRAAYPDASLDVLASPSNCDLFEADPHVDCVHVAARNWFERRPGGWALGSAVWGLGRSLRRAGYDLGIDVRGDILSVLVLALAGIPRRLGWSMGGGAFLLTDVAQWVPGRHEVVARLALLEKLGIRGDDTTRVVVHATDLDRVRVAGWLDDAWPAHTQPVHSADSSNRDRQNGSSRSFVKVRPAHADSHTDAEISESEADHGERAWSQICWLDDAAPLLAAHLGAGTLAKQWPTQHWADLIGRFLADGWRVIVIGGPEDLELGRVLSAHEHLRDWTARLRVSETAALLERADLFIGADSGPAHLAACAGLPSVVLFSGTNQVRQWRPWSRRSLVLRHRVPCQPCHQKVCPLANHPCMTGLNPDRVYHAARRWWIHMQNTGRDYES
jgi:ADP-heptose:LPS heptosyltransferase